MGAVEALWFARSAVGMFGTDGAHPSEDDRGRVAPRRVRLCRSGAFRGREQISATLDSAWMHLKFQLSTKRPRFCRSRAKGGLYFYRGVTENGPVRAEFLFD